VFFGVLLDIPGLFSVLLSVLHGEDRCVGLSPVVVGEGGLRCGAVSEDIYVGSSANSCHQWQAAGCLF
jgi:hypothetical protein